MVFVFFVVFVADVACFFFKGFFFVDCGVAEDLFDDFLAVFLVVPVFFFAAGLVFDVRFFTLLFAVVAFPFFFPGISIPHYLKNGNQLRFFFLPSLPVRVASFSIFFS